MSKFDISQKDNPILLGTYSKDNELFSGDFFVKDDIAFVNDALADEFKILNVSNINQVIEISSINVTYSSKLIDITENVLLFGSNNEEIFLYNITNLKSPTLLQFINLSSTTINIQDFAVKDDILYIIDELGDFIFYNLTNPSLPVLIDTFDNPINGYNIELQFYEDYMFTRQRNRTSFFNITDIHNPNYISSINITTGYIKGCAIYDNILYVLNSTLFIYNVTDIANPVFVSTFTDISSSEKMLIITDYIFITKYSESLNVLDIVDKINPQLIATFGFGGWTRDIFCDGNTAVVANEQDGVLFFDITDKANLVLLNHMKTNHSIRNVILHNNRLYTIRSGQYIDIYNVANIEVPLLFGTYEIPLPFLQSYTDFILDGDYLILMKFNGGFEVIDVSDPSSPVQVSEYVLDSLFNVDMFLDNDILYLLGVGLPGSILYSLLNDRNFLYSYSIKSNGDYPLDGYYSLVLDDYTDILVSGNYIYLASLMNGVVVYRKSAFNIFELYVSSTNFETGLDLFLSEGYLYLVAGIDGFSIYQAFENAPDYQIIIIIASVVGGLAIFIVAAILFFRYKLRKEIGRSREQENSKDEEEPEESKETEEIKS
ncbi:MAG: hypothetical protein ACTSP5_08540 [Candidatus Heimdallarchaeota archaeon]